MADISTGGWFELLSHGVMSYGRTGAQLACLHQSFGWFDAYGDAVPSAVGTGGRGKSSLGTEMTLT
jgi:hypothetical protein